MVSYKVKNTFVHVDVPAERPSMTVRASSAPPSGHVRAPLDEQTMQDKAPQDQSMQDKAAAEDTACITADAMLKMVPRERWADIDELEASLDTINEPGSDNASVYEKVLLSELNPIMGEVALISDHGMHAHKSCKCRPSRGRSPPLRSAKATQHTCALPSAVCQSAQALASEPLSQHKSPQRQEAKGQSPKVLPLVERNEKRLSYVAAMKQTEGYKACHAKCGAGDQKARKAAHTPDARQPCSKRHWEGQILAWRTYLRQWGDVTVKMAATANTESS